MKAVLLALFMAFTCAGCAASLSTDRATAAHPEARPFDAEANARADFDATMSRAETKDKLLLVVMGGNWCHDSRAFAGWMQTDRFAELIEAHYELVYIDVGMPRMDKGRNLDIAKEYDVTIEGTPNVLVLTHQGELLNADSANSWNNAASRSEDAVYDELQSYALRPRL